MDERAHRRVALAKRRPDDTGACRPAPALTIRPASPNGVLAADRIEAAPGHPWPSRHSCILHVSEGRAPGDRQGWREVEQRREQLPGWRGCGLADRIHLALDSVLESRRAPRRDISVSVPSTSSGSLPLSRSRAPPPATGWPPGKSPQETRFRGIGPGAGRRAVAYAYLNKLLALSPISLNR
jgi:hypothetical protein